jgi:REP element-mobilizing transposase RayT
MPYRKTPFVKGEIYHLYNRGNNFERIFLDRPDYIRFLRLLRKYIVSTRTAQIMAYCLMPNHYHLLVCLGRDDLSATMQAMTVAYAKGINKKHGRVGRLFQAPFKAIHVARQDYFEVLLTYIHRNPIEAGLAVSADAWEFSSYRDYVGLRKGTLVRTSLLTSAALRHVAALVEDFGPREANLISALTLE